MAASTGTYVPTKQDNRLLSGTFAMQKEHFATLTCIRVKLAVSAYSTSDTRCLPKPFFQVFFPLIDIFKEQLFKVGDFQGGQLCKQVVVDG